MLPTVQEVQPTVRTRPDVARSGLFVEVEVRGVKAKMLVDTGATDTILSSTLYHRIPGVKRPHLNTSNSGVRNADGTELSTLGRGWIELRVVARISSLNPQSQPSILPRVIGRASLTMTRRKSQLSL